MKPSNAECAVATVHTASAINQDAENAARQVQVMPARLKSADGINRPLEIALVIVRQLIVFHCQITDVWRTGDKRTRRL